MVKVNVFKLIEIGIACVSEFFSYPEEHEEPAIMVKSIYIL